MGLRIIIRSLFVEVMRYVRTHSERILRMGSDRPWNTAWRICVLIYSTLLDITKLLFLVYNGAFGNYAIRAEGWHYQRWLLRQR